MKLLDIESWSRKHHFHTFKDFADPFFAICAEVDVTALKQRAERDATSFFLLSYHLVLRAVNAVEAVRYRIRGDQVVVHDTIHGHCTILNADDTFSYGYFSYFDDYDRFRSSAESALAALAHEPVLAPPPGRDDVVHSSVIPWVHFTSFEHAKTLAPGDSIPKIVLGKYTPRGGRLIMPISVSVHHALMDGIHVGHFFRAYQSLIA